VGQTHWALVFTHYFHTLYTCSVKKGSSWPVPGSVNSQDQAGCVVMTGYTAEDACVIGVVDFSQRTLQPWSRQ